MSMNFTVWPNKGVPADWGTTKRRKNLARRTRESVINLARNLLGDNVDANKIFFINATKDENTGEILYAIQFIDTQRIFQR